MGKQWGLLWCASIYKRISFWFSSIPTCLIWKNQTSVLSESSLKEVHLLLFLERFAQPGRACLLCFTPEFDKVLVSLACRCFGASLCQVRVWSSANRLISSGFLANPQICWKSWEINFLVCPFPLVCHPSNQSISKTFIHGPKIIFVLQQKVFSQMTLPDRREGVRFTDN